MARKVIQIALSNTNLYALCDDGKIYRMNGGEWPSHCRSPSRWRARQAWGQHKRDQARNVMTR